MKVICKYYNTCTYFDTCKYAIPTDENYLNENSICYDNVKEKYYDQYKRKIKLEKINENSTNR